METVNIWNTIECAKKYSSKANADAAIAPATQDTKYGKGVRLDSQSKTPTSGLCTTAAISKLLWLYFLEQPGADAETCFRFE